MWLRNLSQISIASPAAGTRFQAGNSSGKHADLNPPEDYLRMKEWINRVQAAAQKARDEYTEDQAARAGQQLSHPDFDHQHNMNCSEAEDAAEEECADDEAA